MTEVTGKAGQSLLFERGAGLCILRKHVPRSVKTARADGFLRLAPLAHLRLAGAHLGEMPAALETDNDVRFFSHSFMRLLRWLHVLKRKLLELIRFGRVL